MFGDWAVLRGSGKAICTITLANTPAGDDFTRSSSSPAATRW